MRRDDVRGRIGFTLIELMVVIGIVALLMGILLPVLYHVRQSARSAQCLAHLKQVGEVAAVYAIDYADNLPDYRVQWGDAPQPATYSPLFGNDLISFYSHRLYAPPGNASGQGGGAELAGIGKSFGRYARGDLRFMRCPSDPLDRADYFVPAAERSSYFWRHALDAFVFNTGYSVNLSHVSNPGRLVAFHEQAWHDGDQANRWAAADTQGPKRVNASFLDGHAAVMDVPYQAATDTHDANWFFHNSGWDLRERPYDI